MTSPAPRLHANGLRQPKRAPALRFASFRRTGATAAALPPIPAEADYLSRLPGWQLFRNDQVGDCAAITWANYRRLLTAGLGGAEQYPSLDDVLALYKTQNPGFDPDGDPAVDGPGSPADGGMELQTLLEHLHSGGGPDGVKCVAFAQVDTTSPEEVAAAIAIFGGVWLGVLVQDAQQDQFAQGADWTWVEGSPVEGGHAVLAGGYTPAGKRIVTWAQEAGVTNEYLAAGLSECWVTIWPEHLGSVEFLTGVDLAALATAYSELTGRPIQLTPAPAPAPEPQPEPAPEPDPVPVDPAPAVDPAPGDNPAPVDPAPVPDDPAPVDPAPVDPQPTPAPEPIPAPEPAPVQPDPAPVDPQPEPQPDPAPVDPQPEPQPDPAPEPEPQPQPEPEPEPEPQPQPEPEPQPTGDGIDWRGIVESYPWDAADSFIRDPHGLLGRIAVERFRARLIQWAADLPAAD